MVVKVILVPHLIDTEHLSRIGQRGAKALHEKYDSRELTKPARAAFAEKFVNLVDPHRVLAPEERAERIAEARRSYFSAIGKRGAAARRAATAETAVA